jgi:hypothetical protein
VFYGIVVKENKKTAQLSSLEIRGAGKKSTPDETCRRIFP